MSYQIFIVQGNLTRDAEIRQVGQNTVASFGVATSRRYKKQDGTTAEEVEYHDIELWNNSGVHPYLTKGQSVLIQGEIRTDKWQDQQGLIHEKKKVRASVLQLCGAPRQQQGAQQQGPVVAPPQPQYQPQPQPQYQPQGAAGAPPVPPAGPQRQPPQPPVPYPQPGQPGNPNYPPMNSPEYTRSDPGDIPF